jgi:hypothetical protein
MSVRPSRVRRLDGCDREAIMKSLREQICRNDMIDRINTLSPSARPAWGKMNVEQMLSHLVQGNDLPFNATVPDRSSFLSSNVIKPLVLYLLPVPKEVKTSREMDQQQDGRKPMGFEIDRANLIESIQKLGTLPLEHECLGHPFFGKMNAKQWARLAYKHMDHHLRQFGA